MFFHGGVPQLERASLGVCGDEIPGYAIDPLDSRDVLAARPALK